VSFFAKRWDKQVGFGKRKYPGKKSVDKAGKNLLVDVNDNVIVNGFFVDNDRKSLKYYCI
jgi:hypothetical protein